LCGYEWGGTWKNWNERNLENKIYLRLVISIFLTNWLVNKNYHGFQLVGWNYCCDNDVRILIVKVCCKYLIARGESERKWMVHCFVVLIMLNKDNNIYSMCKKKGEIPKGWVSLFWPNIAIL
jgi:hypothetical protein